MPTATVSITLWLPVPIHAAIKAAAEAQGIAVHKWLRDAVSEKLEKEQGK